MNLSAENISKIRELVRSGYPLKARDAQDLLGHNDHLTALLEARFRLMLSVESERDQFQAAIATPESVFINLKAGKIPKPSLRSMIDLYGEVLNGEDAQLLEIAKLRVESEHLRGCEDVLRQLASYCGAGGYNAPEVDPEVFAKKIMDGINILNDPLAQLAEKRGAERDQLKAENELLRKLASKNSSELRKASAWICRAVEVGTESATHWAIRLNKNADLIDATIGEGEQP